MLLANVDDFDPETHTVAYDDLLEIDRYALGVLADMSKACKAAYDSYELHKVGQALVHFCAEDLSAFYIDILKDRMYTNAADSHDRRAAQTVLFKIAQVLAGLMAPVLSYTAEEVWATLYPDADDFVILHNWSDADDAVTPLEYADYEQTLKPKWEAIRAIRAEAAKEIEVVRGTGQVGSSLQSELAFHVAGETYDALHSLGDDLRFVMIASSATVYKAVSADEQKVSVLPSKHAKCARCWHYCVDVGASAEHPTLCGRCETNLFGQAESRKYA